MTKSFLASKTLWFNVVNGVVLFATQLTPDMLPFHPSVDFAKWQALVILVGNYILRFFTSTTLTVNNPDKQP